jgi:hypothetical protein
MLVLKRKQIQDEIITTSDWRLVDICHTHRVISNTYV